MPDIDPYLKTHKPLMPDTKSTFSISPTFIHWRLQRDKSMLPFFKEISSNKSILYRVISMSDIPSELHDVSREFLKCSKGSESQDNPTINLEQKVPKPTSNNGLTKFILSDSFAYEIKKPEVYKDINAIRNLLPNVDFDKIKTVFIKYFTHYLDGKSAVKDASLIAFNIACAYYLNKYSNERFLALVGFQGCAQIMRDVELNNILARYPNDVKTLADYYINAKKFLISAKNKGSTEATLILLFNNITSTRREAYDICINSTEEEIIQLYKLSEFNKEARYHFARAVFFNPHIKNALFYSEKIMDEAFLELYNCHFFKIEINYDLSLMRRKSKANKISYEEHLAKNLNLEECPVSYKGIWFTNTGKYISENDSPLENLAKSIRENKMNS